MENALLCLENTGTYTYHLLEFFTGKNYPLSIESPIAIKRSLGLQRGKNDKIHAKRIAQYAYRFQDKDRLRNPERAVIEELKSLTTLHKRFINASGQLEKPLKEQKYFRPLLVIKRWRKTVNSL